MKTITLVFVFILLSKYCYSQEIQGKFIHANGESLIDVLNIKAKNAVLKSKGYLIRDIKYTKEKDTTINGILFKIIEVEFTSESTRKYTNRYYPKTERNSIQFMMEKNEDWEVVQILNYSSLPAEKSMITYSK